VRCYYVLVHGKLDWQSPPSQDGSVSQPAGFYCYRYVLAFDEAGAARKAFRRVRYNLDEQADWIRKGLAVLALDVEELAQAPMYKLLATDDRGHTFYESE
jgi:hypothetical protein